MANFFKEYQTPIVGGGIAVIYGFLSKTVVNKEIFSVSNGKNIFITFISVFFVGLGAQIFKNEIIEF